MKKGLLFMAVVLMASLALCGCSGSQNGGGTGKTDSAQQTVNQSESSGEVDLSAYQKPADAVRIDLTKDDPSNDAMRFVYDEEGKVSQCYYTVGDQQVYVNYTYKDGCAQIYAFMGDVLAADETIAISAYDAEKGFTAIEGYYFKGVSAK